MSLLTKALGLDRTQHTSVDGALKTAATTAGTNANTDRNNYLDILKSGQGALETSTRSAVDAAMPELNQGLQTSRESAVRRGISTGDLGTSNEGDIYSAFHRHITDSVGQQALGLFGTQLGSAGQLYANDNNSYLSLLKGQQQNEMDAQNAKKAKSSALFGGLGALVGGAFGGPTGAQIGSAIGSGIGG